MFVRLLYEGWVLLAVLYIATGIEYNASRLCINGDGEVELMINFNTNCHPLCSDGFSVKEATVACRELGRPTNRVYITHHERNVTRKGMVPLHEPRCSGGEATLSSCYWGKLQTCRHKYVGVNCSENHTENLGLKSITLDKNNIRVYNGSKVTVTCTATGLLHASHYWYKWTLNDKVVAMAPSVTLTLDKQDNNQILICSVYERDALLQNKSVKLEIYYPPEPYNETTLNFLQGYDVNLTLQVQVSSNPLPNNYTWKRLFSNGTFLSVPSFIKGINKDKSGTYLVTVINRMNVTQGMPMNGSGVILVRLNVFDRPNCVDRFAFENMEVSCFNDSKWDFLKFNVTWENSNSNNNIMVLNTTDTCNVTYMGGGGSRNSCSTKIHILGQPSSVENVTIGSPLSDILNVSSYNWYNWKKLHLQNHLLKNTTFPNIDNVTKDDSGIYYGNDTLGNSTVLKLQVLYEPNVTCNRKVYIPIGESKTITCSIDAFPLATSVWTPGCSNIINSILNQRTRTSCNIDNAKMEDNGKIYTCTASNTMKDSNNKTTMGTDSCNITLTVYDNTRTNYLVVGIVSGVFSILLAAMLVVILLLARLVYRARRGRRGRDRKNSTIPLPVLPSAAQVKEAEGATRRPLPTAPAKVDDNDFQQDVYENA